MTDESMKTIVENPKNVPISQQLEASRNMLRKQQRHNVDEVEKRVKKLETLLYIERGNLKYLKERGWKSVEESFVPKDDRFSDIYFRLSSNSSLEQRPGLDKEWAILEARIDDVVRRMEAEFESRQILPRGVD